MISRAQEALHPRNCFLEGFIPKAQKALYLRV
jgi:hypothetical protein